ncbi:coenzyme F420 hydrogenase/dehydrogenase, beta subunit C-terminal domain protein [delta proteobacterium NaphS2]|nr:coenzyme F420 hydrogenase/dehydrogenase, beta subunit C-terminal domain protein [delta proteobacterium NaphS2]
MPSDPEALVRAAAPQEMITQEMGPVRRLWVTRAKDEDIRNRGQHGGTVTALAAFALEQGLVDAWIMARSHDSLSGVPTVCRTRAQVQACAGTKLTSVPVVGGFLEAAFKDPGRFGVVATPCQCLALAKIKASDHPRLRQAAEKLALVVGLFCGWSFGHRELSRALSGRVDPDDVTGLDIPPSRHQSLEVFIKGRETSVPLSKVTGAVRPACAYCFDMTAEPADLSVGSARLPGGWDEARHWNQTVVRSQMGEDLLERANAAGILTLQEPPEGALEKLKTAAAGKKRTALKNLAQLSKNPDDLLYLPRGFGKSLSSTEHGA